VCGEASNESVTGQGKTSLGFSVYSNQRPAGRVETSPFGWHYAL
jgi:hypothetical protein